MADAPAQRPPRPDIREANKAVVEAYRARGGNEAGATTPLVILTTRGAQTGNDHVTPVAVQPDGDRLIVAGSMGGLPHHPQWYRNLLADPTLVVEYEGETYPAQASTVPDGPERDRLFTLMNQVIPDLDKYQERAKATRQIPIIVLEREG